MDFYMYCEFLFSGAIPMWSASFSGILTRDSHHYLLLVIVKTLSPQQKFKKNDHLFFVQGT